MSEIKFDFDSVEEAIAAFKRGELLVVMDDEDRENEGDLIMSAELATKEQVALMVRYTTGILCVSMTQDIATRLELPPMVVQNMDPKKTAFTVSCDHNSVSTGVSASDRVATIHALANSSSTAQDFHRPGHIFPLVAKPTGVLERRGHTEATVDFCKLAGLKPVGLLAELTNDDGTMCRLPECHAFARSHNLRITTVEALVKYRESLLAEEKVPVTVELIAECEIPIQRNNIYLGNWKMKCFKSLPDGLDKHIALIKGDVENSSTPVLARIHSECFTGHVVGSLRCDCNEQLDIALSMVNERGTGVVLYVDGHEGRGIGLHNKIKAYHQQIANGLDTYQANEVLGLPRDSRTYDAPKAILKFLGVSKVDLITNNPLKVGALQDIIASVVPVICKPNEHNAGYISAKRAFESSPDVNRFSDIIMKSSGHESPRAKEFPLRLPVLDEIAKLKIGVLTTTWNESFVSSLSRLCCELMKKCGITEKNLVIAEPVPGSFELPFAAKVLAASGKVDAIICFGVLIKGETTHFENISNAVSQGLMQVQLTTNVPVINGVLTCLTVEQAEARCDVSSTLPLSLASTAVKMASYKRGVAMDVLSAPMVQPCSHS